MPPHATSDVGAPPRSQRETPKLQRWIDLLAALLARQWPATFDELARGVPSYADDSRDLEARKRMFERDKDELRTFGIPIETVAGEEQPGYRLRKAAFYLPYLALADAEARAVAPPRLARWGYQALRALAFEPDELRAVAEAAARARVLGDPALAAHAAAALRKLAFDLPVDGAAGVPVTVLPPRPRADPAVLDALGRALLARRTVRFRYRSMERDEDAERTVEPWGLFFLGGHWYLAARDPTRGEGHAGLRNFRVARMRDVAPGGRAPQTPDYAIPASFRLREHARARDPWALGDGEEECVVVAFGAETGATRAARRLGEPGATPGERRFRVRRRDAFVRWLLTFGGEVRPVAPPAVVEAWHDQLRRTRAVYDGPPSRTGAGASMAAAPAAAPVPTPRRATPETAAAQLRRILDVVPRIADGEPHALDEVARAAAVEPRTLLRDLSSLSSRLDVPGGFVEGLAILVDPATVEVHTPHFRRPMGLTAAEVRALELGLAVLAAERPADGRAIDGARERLRAVLGAPDDEGSVGELAADGLAPLGEAERAVLDTLRSARLAGRTVRLQYRKAHATQPEARVLEPYALVVAGGRWYAVGRCATSDGLRVFRLDRIERATATDAPFAVPAAFDVHDVLRDGRAFVTDAPPRTLVVRYGPRVARWVAEREERALDADGGLTMEHPLADVDWALRHVLQYGPDAEVLAPEDVRTTLRDRLDVLLPTLAAAPIP